MSQTHRMMGLPRQMPIDVSGPRGAHAHGLARRPSP